ncbi:hypothetical protein KJ596_03110 [Patescibacteria group bacterium]|nr:hypothetical protein [Patescibacteria group bacterium]MBU1868437.1 hypothetical protein [Patescibacteria group bacterium]
MSFYISKLDKQTQVRKGSGFIVRPTGKLVDDFSITYIELNDSRDPPDSDKATEINKGFSCIYVVIQGRLTFTFYEQDGVKETILQEKEYVYVTPGTKYQIKGTGILLTIALPAYSDQMYSHPSI